MSSLYQMVNHLDASPRFVALTLDEVSVAAVSVMLLALSSHKFVSISLCALLFGGLKILKQGRGPKYLWVLAYWHLPSLTTHWMLRALPASHRRVWRV